MEYMDNGDLLNYLKDKPHTETELTKFVIDACLPVVHLHKLEILHRYIAARNYLVNKEGKIKLSDFGLAKFMENSSYYGNEGTPLPVKWCSPEVLSKYKFSFASDVWAFGVTCFEILSEGVSPFCHVSDNLKNAIINGAKVCTTKPKKNCSDEFWNLIEERCFCSDPVQRWTINRLHDGFLNLHRERSPQTDQKLNIELPGNYVDVSPTLLEKRKKLSKSEKSEDELVAETNEKTEEGNYSSKNVRVSDVLVTENIFKGTYTFNNLSTPIAAKKLTKEESLIQEIKIGKKIQHENVIKIFGQLNTNTSIYVISEPIIGDLKMFLLDMKVCLTDKFKFMMHIVVGLNHMHTEHFIHGNLSAVSILIALDPMNKWVAKISNFDKSVLVGKNSQSKGIPDEEFIAWAAKETLAQGTFSFQTDIHSLAIVFF